MTSELGDRVAELLGAALVLGARHERERGDRGQRRRTAHAPTGCRRGRRRRPLPCPRRHRSCRCAGSSILSSTTSAALSMPFPASSLLPRSAFLTVSNSPIVVSSWVQRRVASASSRSSVTAWARPSGSRYSAEPATNTLAPAAAAPWIVDGAIPPSTSMSTSWPPSRIEAPHLGDLRLHRVDVVLAAEAGVDRHHEHEVDQVEHVGHRAGGRRRVERHAPGGPPARGGGRACGAGGGTPRRGR